MMSVKDTVSLLIQALLWLIMAHTGCTLVAVTVADEESCRAVNAMRSEPAY